MERCPYTRRVDAVVEEIEQRQRELGRLTKAAETANEPKSFRE
jgi:hypothetical protein